MYHTALRYRNLSVFQRRRRLEYDAPGVTRARNVAHAPDEPAPSQLNRFSKMVPTQNVPMHHQCSIFPAAQPRGAFPIGAWPLRRPFHPRPPGPDFQSRRHLARRLQPGNRRPPLAHSRSGYVHESVLPPGWEQLRRGRRHRQKLVDVAPSGGNSGMPRRVPLAGLRAMRSEPDLRRCDRRASGHCRPDLEAAGLRGAFLFPAAQDRSRRGWRNGAH